MNRKKGVVIEVLTCFNSYPEFSIIGGSSKLKKTVCLNVCIGIVCLSITLA